MARGWRVKRAPRVSFYTLIGRFQDPPGFITGRPNLNMRVHSSCSNGPRLKILCLGAHLHRAPNGCRACIRPSYRRQNAFSHQHRRRTLPSVRYNVCGLGLPYANGYFADGNAGSQETFQNPSPSLRGVLPRQKHCMTMPLREQKPPGFYLESHTIDGKPEHANSKRH
jgi:hypothetical protein